ncbi:MAG: tripartite tricarboxylate transporter TctB family protein [Rhizobacter sp.]|nr:tripartite tricarboxylate transporter TctB family protein [Rhizobacter sp.]
MKIKSERDFWSGLVFFVVGVVVAIGATNYSMGPPCPEEDPCATSLRARLAHLSAEPGPGFFPLGLAIVLALLGAIVLFKALTIESDEGDRVAPLAWRPALAVVGAVALFGALLAPLGLALAGPVLIVVASLGADEFRWRAVLASAIVLTMAVRAFFVWGLRLTVPLWPAFVR